MGKYREIVTSERLGECGDADAFIDDSQQVIWLKADLDPVRLELVLAQARAMVEDASIEIISDPPELPLIRLDETWPVPL